MKVLIDISQEILENPYDYCCYALANQIKGNYTPIPDNATNGDMIKAMFPYIKIHEHEKTDICDAYIQIDIWDFSICVSKDWWNAPYGEKRGNEE